MNKVLIVDDEVLSIEYLKSLSAWKKYGCTEIDSAWIASKALERFKKEHYPVVFMDIRMPGMDGLALSREFLKICPDTVIGRDYRALVGVYAERNGGGDLRSVYTNEVTAKR